MKLLIKNGSFPLDIQLDIQLESRILKHSSERATKFQVRLKEAIVYPLGEIHS